MVEAVDTIAAQATPPGRGGVGIVRVSGPLSAAIARAVLGRCPAPRHATVLPFLDAAGGIIDEGIALYFPAPHSFTGEDVLELHGHGGPVILDLLLARVLALGARPARPGEFSERAFLNDKLDLAQAEAIADLIDAGSAQAARSASRSLQGEFSTRIDALVEAIVALRTLVEAAIDFPDEEIDFLRPAELGERLASLRAQLEAVQSAARQGQLLREGMTVVIAGRPNAGKSSLLNALAGRESAIVTEIPGTTRDVLREHLVIDGLPLHVIDTAGLRDSADPIEQEGVRRAWAEIEQADRLLLVVDDSRGFGPDEEALRARLPAGVPLTVVYNKVDLSGRAPGPVSPVLAAAPDAPPAALGVSARSGEGLGALRDHLKASVGYDSGEAGTFTARRRHLDALRAAATHLNAAADHLTPVVSAELLAEDLRQAQRALGEITGEFSSDELLGRIFADFCIGK
ncbi:MAG: tRNA uridine-5-carboxymethylaminomethyl(34) synthesis GTPase MnmE [Gammaproteobacteria bacterium]